MGNVVETTLPPFTQIFTATASMSPRPGYTTARVTCIGGGASGYDSDSGVFRSGGGGGAWAQSIVTFTPSDALTVTVGQGGKTENPGAPSELRRNGIQQVLAGPGRPNGGGDGSASGSIGQVRFSGSNGGTVNGPVGEGSDPAGGPSGGPGTVFVSSVDGAKATNGGSQTLNAYGFGGFGVPGGGPAHAWGKQGVVVIEWGLSA